MAQIHLKDDSGYQAVFLPEEGMTLASFKKGDLEVIDPETKVLFEKRHGGLGPLIGPHFHERPLARIPSVPELENHPLYELARKTGRKDPFSHGMARYAKWEYESTETLIKGKLTGEMEFEGIPLKRIEGQNFFLTFEARLSEKGLHIDYGVVSDTDSLVGFHYYFRLPNKQGTVISKVKERALIEGEMHAIPEAFGYSDDHSLKFVLDKEADYTFYPFLQETEANIQLETDEFLLDIVYQCESQENAWQLWHPNHSTFVCIEPLSAKNPKKPILTASSLSLSLGIEDRKDLLPSK
ncbi:MAG: hypothetical protein KDK62_05590 [Chlamydiia bacterium]|nr:hypothetical protein [Chlamydiia bacterium]